MPALFCEPVEIKQLAKQKFNSSHQIYLACARHAARRVDSVAKQAELKSGYADDAAHHAARVEAYLDFEIAVQIILCLQQLQRHLAYQLDLIVKRILLLVYVVVFIHFYLGQVWIRLENKNSLLSEYLLII